MAEFNIAFNVLSTHPLSTGLVALFLSFCCVALYRTFFHPLSGFPGPKIAAVTYFYEFYHDFFKGGNFTSEIERLHQQYGPIVRINPEELHCNDPEWIDQIYAAGGKRRNKSAYFMAQFGVSQPGTIGTIFHEHHRLRRSALNRYFSKAAVTKLEPLIHKKAQKLCDALIQRSSSGEPVDLATAYSCLTTDVVTEYCFAQSPNFVGNASFEPNMRQAVLSGVKVAPITKQWPWMFPLMRSIPDSWVSKLLPEMAVLLRFESNMNEQIDKVKQDLQAGLKKNEELEATIFHEILIGSLPDEEKSTERLAAEGQSMISAGTETTAWTLAAITAYLLTQPTTLSKLQAELKPIVSDSTHVPSWSTLEKLVFFNAVILEGIRLTYGVAARQPRAAPDEELQLKSSKTGAYFRVPAGTPIGMTSVLIHHNSDIFPDPLSFRPERWINEQGGIRTDLQRYLLSFSKGSRQCLGMQLAYAELYITLAAVLRRVIGRMTLFRTTIENDVQFDHETFVPRPKKESLGVRVIIE